MENLYDVIIIGSGPAGLSAAIYAKRAKLSSLTIEANFASGGQVLNTYEVDNYPGLPGISGMDLGSTLRAHAEKMGAEFSRERVKELVLDEEIKIVRTPRLLPTSASATLPLSAAAMSPWRMRFSLPERAKRFT